MRSACHPLPRGRPTLEASSFYLMRYVPASNNVTIHILQPLSIAVLSIALFAFAAALCPGKSVTKLQIYRGVFVAGPNSRLLHRGLID
jgi:hypothetical protein